MNTISFPLYHNFPLKHVKKEFSLAGLLTFSKNGRQKVSALKDFCLCWDIPDHLTLLQNCHKHNNSLEFHCNVLTSTVVGNMTQAYEVAYAEVYCGKFREVKYTHGVEISLSHETLGMPGKNETILTRITTKTRPSDAQRSAEKLKMENVELFS